MFVKFAEMDLKQPLQPIYVDTRYSWLFVVVSWGYVPLGMLRVQCAGDTRTIGVERLQSEILHTVGWSLWEQAIAGTLHRFDPHTDQWLPPISVVVCTRDRALSLARCLQTLARLDYPTYEVVVVDNGSQDPTVAQVVAESGFRYVREDRPGLDWARNCGIKAAQNDIIAYIDDDALATPGWLRGIAQGFADPQVMAVTGMVLPAEIETPAQHDFETYGGMSKGFIGYTIHRNTLSSLDLFRAHNWGVGANMAFRRPLFDAVGDFDVALDVGTPASGGGDLEFFFRTVVAGYTLRYEPVAMVRHVHRRDTRMFKRQIYNNGRAFAAYLLTIARTHPDKRAAVCRFLVQGWAWPWMIRRLLQALIRRDKWTCQLALTELWGSCSAPWAYWKAQRVALQQKLGQVKYNTVKDGKQYVR